MVTKNVLTGAIFGTIALVIMDSVISAQNFTGLTGTITSYVVPVGALAILVLSLKASGNK